MNAQQALYKLSYIPIPHFLPQKTDFSKFSPQFTNHQHLQETHKEDSVGCHLHVLPREALT